MSNREILLNIDETCEEVLKSCKYIVIKFFLKILRNLPKKASSAVLFLAEPKPSSPFMKRVLSLRGLGRSWPASIYTPSEYAGGLFLVMCPSVTRVNNKTKSQPSLPILY